MLASEKLDFSLIKSFYHISPEGAEAPYYELPAALLLDRVRAFEALSEHGRLWKATGLELPASTLGGTFFNLTVMNLVFSAQFNLFVKLPLEALTLQLEEHHDHAHVGYKINTLETIDIPQSPAERERVMKTAWTEYMAVTVIPALNAIALAAEVKPDLIWNQFGGQIHSVRAYIREHVPAPGLADLIDAEFAILEALPADVFQRRRNPFHHKPRYIDNPWSPPNGQYIVRSSCCMYDRRENGTKCYTCPMMLPEEREQRRQQVIAEQAAQQ